MALSIALQNKKTVWHPGDAVEGTVHLQPSSQLNVARVELVFEGESKVVQSDHNGLVEHNSSRVMLFRKKLMLLRGPYTIASPQKWPFTLDISETCECGNERGWVAAGSSADAFESKLSQPLPPTILTGEENAGFSYNVDIAVKYWIQAKVTVDGAFHKDLDMWIPLRIMPYRDELLRNPTPKHKEVAARRTVQSIHLDPDVGDRSLRLSEKLKATFGSSSVPSSNYEIVVDFPEQGILKEAPYILLSVRRSKDHPTDPLPQVELKSFSVHLNRETGYAFKQPVILANKPDVARICRTESEVAHWSGSQLIDGKIDLRNLYKYRFTDWKNVVPDFATFNVNEHHTLTLKMEFEAARQTSKVIIPGPSFKILSPHLRSVGENSLPPADTMEGDLELPQYEEQVKH